MGAVGSFIKDVAVDTLKAGSKFVTSAVGNAIPVVGPVLANKLNSLYAKGGRVVCKADGGMAVPAGVKKIAINTPGQLISLIKAHPELAEKHDLSVEKVKEAVEEHEMMKKGGMRHHEEHHGMYAHGGRVTSLPVSDLDRLNRFAHGGPVGLSHNEHEESYAVLHHGRAPHHHHAHSHRRTFC